MTSHPTQPDPAVFMDVLSLRLLETGVPPVPAQAIAAMDRLWEQSVAANPHLFDGPVVACTTLAWNELDRDLALTWTRATYRHRCLRQVLDSAWKPSSVFVTVLQPTDGGLVAGRESPSTAAPGRWTLPGGTAEPPPPGQPLDLAALRSHAARELVEEVGIETAPERLTLYGATQGERGNVGLHFLAEPLPLDVVHDRYQSLLDAERARGISVELDQLTVLGSVAQLPSLGYFVDYLPPILQRFSPPPAPGRYGR
ncbi:NUDIX domain-containing protein [Streptacidiphilus sp. EB103A]|uniref:NUDIX domain-containing protein n=1 Tax=Streptacidiphilus sp. EB103A TaxID=3156275 RepID=UPI003513208F